MDIQETARKYGIPEEMLKSVQAQGHLQETAQEWGISEELLKEAEDPFKVSDEPPKLKDGYTFWESLNIPLIDRIRGKDPFETVGLHGVFEKTQDFGSSVKETVENASKKLQDAAEGFGNFFGKYGKWIVILLVIMVFLYLIRPLLKIGEEVAD